MAGSKKRSAKGTKKSENNSTKKQKLAGNPLDDFDGGLLSDESKQSNEVGKASKKVKTATMKENSEDFVNKKGTSRRNVTRVEVQDDEEVVMMEVEGMDEDFIEEQQVSEDSNSELNEEVSSEGETEEEPMQEEDENNNATKNSRVGRKQKKQLTIRDKEISNECDSEADMIDEPQILELNVDDPDDEFGEKEAILFAKWEKYMKHKGLVKTAPGKDKNQEGCAAAGSDKQQRSQFENTRRPNPSLSRESGFTKKGRGSYEDKGEFSKGIETIASPSESTIYKPAVEKAKTSDRNSSSSEDLDIDDGNEQVMSNNNLDVMIGKFLGRQRVALDEAERQQRLDQMMGQQQQHRPEDRQDNHNNMLRQVEEEAEQRARQASKGKDRAFEVSGKDNFPTWLFNEDFMVLAANLDESLTKKIEAGEYVNFAKLIQKDKLLIEDETRLELVNRGGVSYWVPLVDRDNVEINNIGKWDQAFRVFSKIYTRANPARGAELVEYSYIIHSAANIFLGRTFIHMTNFLEPIWPSILKGTGE